MLHLLSTVFVPKLDDHWVIKIIKDWNAVKDFTLKAKKVFNLVKNVDFIDIYFLSLLSLVKRQIFNAVFATQ
jgi:hypothetical protein